MVDRAAREVFDDGPPPTPASRRQAWLWGGLGGVLEDLLDRAGAPGAEDHAVLGDPQ